MNRLALIAIGGGSASAMIFLSVMVSPILGLFLSLMAPLPLFLIGLGIGPRLGALAGIAGTVVTAGVGDLLMAANFLFGNAIPVGIVLRQVFQRRVRLDGTVEWQSSGWALSWLSVFGCLGAILAWNVSDDVAKSLRQAMNVTAAGLSPEQIEAAVSTVAPLLPGMLIALWIVMLAINGAIAQSVLTRNGGNKRPSERLQDLRLPEWLSWALVGSAVVALVGGGDFTIVGRNLVIILSVPFLFLGLAVIHLLVRRTPFPHAVLAIFYFLLIVTGWTLLVLPGIGMIEQWAGLRRRFGAQHEGQENEPWK